ncbi:MAG TPA: cobalamin-independent methionine synthase II family protein [Chloroflexota bacterium]|nr:cobalamin-independent methionine synthase II family protein [Chloroflexota bacterium]
MKLSTDRIRVSHQGTLPRPAKLQELFVAGESAEAEFQQQLPAAVAEAVKRQAQIGIDMVNDGEYSKRGGFNQYVVSRLNGLETREIEPRGPGSMRSVTGRDEKDFPGAFAAGVGTFRRAAGTNIVARIYCTGPIEYVGLEQTRQDIANLKAAVPGLDVEAYLPAIAPGTIEHWLWNEHYASDEDFLFAVADAMHEEYKAITDAGLILQIDNPDLPDGWQIYPEMSVAQYREYADLRVEALNRALRGIPEEQVRLHVCWGSGHGPHLNDIPLAEIIDLIMKVPAQCYSIEASNPRHEHEWRVFEKVKVPDGKMIMPGVVGHVSDIVEHPRVVADRLIRYAKLIGREKVAAGTDCGIGSRVGHGEIAWAKLEALVEGARLASQELWS